jgi:SNF2 family DNA or RNA helicase
MQKVAIKRLKSEILDLHLPSKEEKIVIVNLEKNELEVYNAIALAIKNFVVFIQNNKSIDRNKNKNNSNDENGDDNNSNNSMLTLVMRLRQACLDLRLIPIKNLIQLLSSYETLINKTTKKETVKKTKQNTTATINKSKSIIVLNKNEQEQLKNKFFLLFKQVGIDEAMLLNNKNNNNNDDENDESNNENNNDQNICCICLENLDENSIIVLRICQHSLCSTCDETMLKNYANNNHNFNDRPYFIMNNNFNNNNFNNNNNNSSGYKCPLCRSVVQFKDRLKFIDLEQIKIAIDENKIKSKNNNNKNNNNINTINNETEMNTKKKIENYNFDVFTSSKTKAILHELNLVPKGDRVVIFSNFNDYLNILEKTLLLEGFKVLKITGFFLIFFYCFL